ncbi:MAG: hypothetical protein R3E32_28070 [Chitinophagales bacterium]
MDINNQNYEEFAIDYLEGNLSPELEEVMQLFLLQNPDIEAELMGLEGVVLEADLAIGFPDKAALLQLEERSKVVPLFRQWKRYVLPIAAALCLFFVVQLLLQPVENQNNNKKVEVIAGGNDAKTNDGNKGEIADVEENKEGDIENEMEKGNENNSEMENNLKPKVNLSKSIAVNQPSTAKMNTAKNIQHRSKLQKETNTIQNVNVAVNQGFERENRGGVTGFEKPIEDAAMEAVATKQRDETIAVVEEHEILEVKKTVAVKEKEVRDVLTLTALPSQSGEVAGESIVVANVDFRELPQAEVIDIESNKENNRTKSTFFNNLKRAITPEVLASDDMYESGTDSEILVSISMKPEQHDFIKKIFKNNR